MSVPLIIYTGESNSGGYALNSSATSGEISDRPSIQILNNNTLAGFEDLNISSGNNLYGHNGAETWQGVRHGWELEMANRIESGTFIPSPCYLVKTGQGASKIADWLDPTGLYSYNGSANTVNPWQAFKERVDKAIELLTTLTGIAPRLYIFYSQGINDAIAGTDINTWKTNTLAHIDQIRSRYGANIPIVITKFSSTYATYNAAIDEIITQRGNLFSVNTLDCSLQVDGNHWDYAGMKSVSDRMMDCFLANTDINPNIFAGRPNVVVAKANKSFIDAGFTTDNMSIVYECGSTESPRSWMPNREINAITGFETGKGYYMMPLQDLALPDIVVPPLPLLE